MRSLVLLFVAVLAGCSTQEPVAAAAPAMAPAARPMKAPSGAAVTGTVLETLEASTYTYLRLNTRTGEQWAAIPSAVVAVGSEVTLVNPMPMTNFASKTLNRTFAQILFATGLEAVHPGAPMPAKAAAPHASGFDELSAWAAKAEPAAMIPKAIGADAKTVAEIYSQRAVLKEKPVLLRGKVVKYTSGVLGKNWLHLRDGSGSAENKDNDIAVTTTEQVALGDVIAVHGPVHLERDFGAGYTFPVIIEDASIVR